MWSFGPKYLDVKSIPQALIPIPSTEAMDTLYLSTLDPSGLWSLGLYNKLSP